MSTFPINLQNSISVSDHDYDIEVDPDGSLSFSSSLTDEEEDWRDDLNDFTDWAMNEFSIFDVIKNRSENKDLQTENKERNLNQKYRSQLDIESLSSSSITEKYFNPPSANKKYQTRIVKGLSSSRRKRSGNKILSKNAPRNEIVNDRLPTQFDITPRRKSIPRASNRRNIYRRGKVVEVGSVRSKSTSVSSSTREYMKSFSGHSGSLPGLSEMSTISGSHETRKSSGRFRFWKA